MSLNSSRESKIRGVVQAQVCETDECAIILALVPHEVLVDSRKSGHKQWPAARVNQAAYRSDACKPGLKVGQGELWCKRQLRDYKHANHLCFKCGEIFDANRKCGKKWNAELHLVHTEDMP
jgi:hypothetical protein